jgi:hypothetical protein
MVAVPFIDITRTVFPVIALRPEQTGEMARPDFFGTAFAVGPGVFMTAAHVAKAAGAHGEVAIGGPSSVDGHAILGAARAHHVETWPDRDVALIFCTVGGLTELKLWLVRPLQLLTDLGSFGYPHAVTLGPAGNQMRVVFRGYKGYVITTRRWERLPGEPSVYEVSCPFPLGMSGAPVLLHQDNDLAVAGMVLGIDTVEYGGVAQNVGIVLAADEIVGLNSEKLGGRIAAQLGFFGGALLPPDQTLEPSTGATSEDEPNRS